MRQSLPPVERHKGCPQPDAECHTSALPPVEEILGEIPSYDNCPYKLGIPSAGEDLGG